MLALSLCAEVDIYGFLRGGGNHYYLKRLATKSPGCGGEPQDGKLMETMSARPRIQNTTTYAKSQKPARHCSKAKPWFLKHFFAVEDFGELLAVSEILLKMPPSTRMFCCYLIGPMFHA